MLFSDLYKIMVKKITFVGFSGAIVPTPGSAPESAFEYRWTEKLLLQIVKCAEQNRRQQVFNKGASPLFRGT